MVIKQCRVQDAGVRYGGRHNKRLTASQCQEQRLFRSVERGALATLLAQATNSRSLQSFTCSGLCRPPSPSSVFQQVHRPVSSLDLALKLTSLLGDLVQLLAERTDIQRCHHLDLGTTVA
jgi:hypothetical protein